MKNWGNWSARMTVDFKNKTLKRQFASYKWARNNTLQLLKAAEDAGVLQFLPQASHRSILYQFQCLATTDDTYFRKLTSNTDKRFGIYKNGKDVWAKEDIPKKQLKSLLQTDLSRIENLLAKFAYREFEEHAQTIQSIINHEYLHQGQLVVLFRLAGVAMPERFKNAFDL